MGHEVRRGRYANSIDKAALLSVSYLALCSRWRKLIERADVAASAGRTTGCIAASPVQIEEPTRKPKRQRAQPSNRAGAAAARRTATPQTTPAPQPSVWASTYDTSDRHGRRLHKQHFGRDQSEYAADQHPAVDLSPDKGFHQRIRASHRSPTSPAMFRAWPCIRAKAIATSSSFAASIRARTSSSTASATTFNTSAISTTRKASRFLKGPSALTFGRGAGGGLLNRTLKEADWHENLRGNGQTGSTGIDASLSMPARPSTTTSPPVLT